MSSALLRTFFRLNMMGLLIAAMGCTQAATRQFNLAPANDSVDAGFEAGEEVTERHSVPIDILWVIDNSDSMASSQEKLRNGLSNFASKFLLQDGIDIQMAVITTDAFVANTNWTKYLSTPGATSKKTPIEWGKSFGLTYGPDYAKLSASAIVKTKGGGKGLVSKFEQLVSVGIKGIYEEHGFDSVLQFIADNEKNSPNKLFRPDSQRIIVFLSDEDEQSLTPQAASASTKLLYHDSYYTGKDVAKANAILPEHETIDCPASTVEGTTLAPTNLCVRPGLELPVSSFKTELDDFFRSLDGASKSSYFIAAIVAKDLKTIQALRAATTEKTPEGAKVIDHDQGARYIDLVNQVGNGSFAMDIGATNYSPILDKIGLEIVKRYQVPVFKARSQFRLTRAPATNEKVVVTLDRSGGGSIELADNQYSVSKNIVTITDKNLISSLKLGDRIRVKYQPSTVLPATN